MKISMKAGLIGVTILFSLMQLGCTAKPKSIAAEGEAKPIDWSDKRLVGAFIITMIANSNGIVLTSLVRDVDGNGIDDFDFKYISGFDPDTSLALLPLSVVKHVGETSEKITWKADNVYITAEGIVPEKTLKFIIPVDKCKEFYEASKSGKTIEELLDMLRKSMKIKEV